MKTILHTFVNKVDAFNDCVGRGLSWLSLIMAIVMFVIVILRYGFDVGWIWMQESVVYMHGALFMLAAGYTLLKESHVRVDIFYRPLSPTCKAIVDLGGATLLLVPTCLLLLFHGFPYVADSWTVFEGSKEAGGIPAVFLLKTVILLGAVFLGLQGLSQASRSILTLTGDRAVAETTLKEVF